MEKRDQQTVNLYAIYTRVSTDEQRAGISISFQIQTCQAWIARQAGIWECIGIFKEDYTGFEYERPEMSKLWELAKQKQINALIVLRRDRFSRGEAASLILETHFSKHHVRLFSVDEGEFTIGVKNRILSAVERSMSEETAESSKKNMREKRRAYVERGAIPSQGFARYGYTKEGKRDQTKYVINEDQAIIIRLIFSLYNQRVTLQQIADTLNEQGVSQPSERLATQRSNHGWTRRVVHNIIDYAALYHGTMTAYKHAVRVDAPEPFSLSVPAIIDDQTYTTFLYTKSLATQGRTINHEQEYLLLGRLTCECGYSYIKHAIPRDDKTGYYYYYRCSSTKFSYAKKVCTIRNVPVKLIDDVVWNFTKVILGNSTYLSVVKLYFLAQNQELHIDRTGDKEKTDNKIAQYKQELDILLIDYSRSKGLLREKLFNQCEEISQIIEDLECYKATLPEIEIIDTSVSTTDEQQTYNILQLVLQDACTAEQKRKVLSALEIKITLLSRDKIRIYYQDSIGDIDL